MEIKDYIVEHENLKNKISDLIRKEVQRFSNKTKVPITKININIDYYHHIVSDVNVTLNQTINSFD